MFEREIALSHLNRRYLGRLVEDMTEDNLDHQPAPGLHSARWILSHLAIVSDSGLKLLGLPMRLPLEWHAAYGMGSAPGSHERIRRSLEQLMAAITEGYSAVAETVKSASPQVLEQPHGIERLNWTGLTTRAELLAHLLTTHFALHIGQLSTLRRLQGKPHLF